MQLTTTLNHDLNHQSFLLKETIPSKKDQRKRDKENTDDTDGDDKDEGEVNIIQDSDDILQTICIVLAMLLSAFILVKCMKKTNEKSLANLTDDMTDTNIIEINEI